MKLRERIREQSKQVADYMKKPQKYQVLWDCPHCGNSHTWWWEDKFEAFHEGECHMVCDRCDERVKCTGDGHGYYTPVEENTGGKQRTLEQVNLTLDELQTSRQNHFSLLSKLSARADDLDDLNTDVHNYCRSLEDKVNRLREDNKLAFDAINTIAKRLAEVETGGIFDNLSRRMVTAELAIANLEDGISVKTYSDSRKKDQPSVLDLIHGTKPPFHERFREGCGFSEETLDGETIAKMLRFIAVEVERMTERDMGGSFTISNLKVGEKLRELADEAQNSEYAAGFDWGVFVDEGDGEEEEPGWGLYGYEGDKDDDDDPNNPALAEDGN